MGASSSTPCPACPAQKPCPAVAAACPPTQASYKGTYVNDNIDADNCFQTFTTKNGNIKGNTASVCLFMGSGYQDDTNNKMVSCISSNFDQNKFYKTSDVVQKCYTPENIASAQAAVFNSFGK